MAELLILGGTGWLSGEIARQAVASGHRVTALARGGRPAPGGVELVCADRDRPGAYDELQRDWDAVLDISWQPGQVRGALAALGDRASSWVYVSSGSVYLPADAPAGDETDPTHPPLDGETAVREQYAQAKAACEAAVLAADGPRAVVARSGLIGGPGDPSDRYGYWPAAFARAGTGRVLAPAIGERLTQCIDVRDLAAWLLRAALDESTRGVYDAYGEPRRFADVLAAAREATGFEGELVEADPAWLIEHGVDHYMGPRSLPLWLPAEHELAVTRRSHRAVHAGLRHRPLVETMRDVTKDELARGVGRERIAGLSATEQDELLAALGR